MNGQTTKRTRPLAMESFLLPLPRGMRCSGDAAAVPDDEMITATRSASLPEEGYELTVRDGRVRIAAATDAGEFYARQTLLQLRAAGRCGELAIRDAPALPYRGFLIDSCRHFYGVEELKKVIDAASRFKLNRFHWHLTDDQGWRIEIKRYPLLTRVGGYRSNSRFGGVEEGGPHGGFFTQAQIKEIVDHCAERMIEVVPEIDMPGHFTAAIAAYPFLGCTGEPMESTMKEGIFPNVLCVGNPDAVAFVKNVLDEVCALFPGRYIHVGGDEAPRTRWRECTKCTAELQRRGLPDYHALQGSFIKEIASYLKEKGKTAITWNESLRGGRLSPDDVTVQRWMDRGRLCSDFAGCGGRLIESDFYHYYFDYPYGMTPLKKAFAYDPCRAPDQDAVIGVEGTLWTEYVRSFDDLSQKLFPRLFVIAERGWSGYGARSYDDFRAAAVRQLPALDKAGLPVLLPSAWDPGPAARLKKVYSFFKGSLTPDLLRQVMENK